MKKTIVFLAIFLVCVILPKLSHAQSVATSGITSASSSPVTEMSPINRDKNQPRALTTAAQVRLTNLAANVSNRLDAYVRRIANVTNRLDSRAAKLADSGLDVSAAKQKITTARNEIEKAQISLNNIDTIVHNFVQSENPQTYWPSLKTTYQNAQTNIKLAHKATVETLLLLKAANSTLPPTTVSTTSVKNNLE